LGAFPGLNSQMNPFLLQKLKCKKYALKMKSTETSRNPKTHRNFYWLHPCIQIRQDSL